MADASVDHVITDPPYSEHVDGNSMRGRGHRAGGRKQALGFKPLTVSDMEACADRFARICKRWVLVFCAQEQVHEWRGALTSAGLEYVRCGVWVKENATPQFTGDRPGQGFEAIVIAHQPGRKRWNSGGKLGVWTSPTAYRDGDDIVHTTQKPLSLMEALVRDFTDPGETILDPFAGSGTTGVACIRLGRNFIGFERDEKFHAAAMKRLAGTREQLQLIKTKAPKPRQGKLAI